MRHNIKAIQTRYKGYRFRSRLEARWAVFFDALRLKWDYEAEGYVLGKSGLYLPDFYLPELRGGTYVEVKRAGYKLTEGEIYQFLDLTDGTGKIVLLATGAPDAVSYQGTDPLDPNGSAGKYWFTWTEANGAGLGLWGGEAFPEVTPHHAIRAARGARFEFGETPE